MVLIFSSKPFLLESSACGLGGHFLLQFSESDPLSFEMLLQYSPVICFRVLHYLLPNCTKAIVQITANSLSSFVNVQITHIKSLVYSFYWVYLYNSRYHQLQLQKKIGGSCQYSLKKVLTAGYSVIPGMAFLNFAVTFWPIFSSSLLQRAAAVEWEDIFPPCDGLFYVSTWVGRLWGAQDKHCFWVCL